MQPSNQELTTLREIKKENVSQIIVDKISGITTSNSNIRYQLHKHFKQDQNTITDESIKTTLSKWNIEFDNIFDFNKMNIDDLVKNIK